MVGDRYGNLDAVAWCADCSGDRTQPLGQKTPNTRGLHDMLERVVSLRNCSRARASARLIM